MKNILMNKFSNERGVALVMTLMIIFVFTILGSVFIMRTINEKNISEREKLWNQAYFVAETGGDAALAKLDELINTDLLTTVNNANPNVLGNKAETYANTNNGLGFLLDYVKHGGTAQFTLSGSELSYNSGAISYGSGSYSYGIVLRQKENPTTIATDIWDFPFFYQINATATVGSVTRKVRLDGDLTVRVQRDNFAKYALFTDHHSLPSTATVWFTSLTNFAGPLHTNERYSFAFNPSGTFYNTVTQHHTTARFQNNGFPILADADNNGTVDVPVFNSTYDRGVNEIVLASSVMQTDLANQAKGGTTIPGTGIYVPASGGNLIGGIYIKGNPAIILEVDGSGNARYNIDVPGAQDKVITVNQSTNQTTVHNLDTGAITTYSGKPYGEDGLGTLIYVDGTVTSLKGTVQRDTEVTVSSQGDINITDNIKYQDYDAGSGTPGAVGYVPPSAAGHTNLLGILSWGGNVNVATSAPNNVEIHGIVMARNGIFQVNNYDSTGVGPRGVATLLGGVITQFYGAFGLYNTATGAQVAGYGRNFVYDSRTLMGKAPPYFPSMKTFIAFTNDLTDKVTYQEGGF